MKIIVIDGADGSGKATQADILVSALKEKYDNVFLVSFPNYHSKGSKLLEMYLQGELDKDPNNVNACVASSLFAIDRYMYFKETYFPEDSILVCNRYTLSNLIHQMCKMPQKNWYYFASWLKYTEYDMFNIPKPDIQLYLYVRPEISYDLISKRYNGDESKRDIHESYEFLKQSATPIESYIAGNQAAKMAFSDEKLTVIDCNKDHGAGIRSISSIADEILAHVESELLKSEE